MRTPEFKGDLQSWIADVDTYLRDLENIVRQDALGLKVPHVRPNQPPRATQNGLVMFDNATGQLVVSNGGTFRALATTPITL